MDPHDVLVGKEDDVAFPLVIPFLVLVADVLRHDPAESAFAEEDHP